MTLSWGARRGQTKTYSLRSEMAYYSNTKLSTFEQCPHKYRLQYIEKAPKDYPNTIECFMGNIVHKVLEAVYKGEATKLNDVLVLFEKLWSADYVPGTLIAKKLPAQHYFDLGQKFLIHYHNSYKPFDEMDILGLETKDYLKLPDGNFWHVKIDKLGRKGDTFYVCDYKTSSWMKTEEQARVDRQLALYGLWVKRKYPEARIVVKWHMLAFDKEVAVEFSEEELEGFASDVVEQIKNLEACKVFERQTGILCNYCVYRESCRQEMIENGIE